LAELLSSEKRGEGKIALESSVGGEEGFHDCLPEEKKKAYLSQRRKKEEKKMRLLESRKGLTPRKKSASFLTGRDKRNL